MVPQSVEDVCFGLHRDVQADVPGPDYIPFVTMQALAPPAKSCQSAAQTL
jgi:hypothetical protein